MRNSLGKTWFTKDLENPTPGSVPRKIKLSFKNKTRDARPFMGGMLVRSLLRTDSFGTTSIIIPVLKSPALSPIVANAHYLNLSMHDNSRLSTFPLTCYHTRPTSASTTTVGLRCIQFKFESWALALYDLLLRIFFLHPI